jgi:hypothetical protein
VTRSTSPYEVLYIVFSQPANATLTGYGLTGVLIVDDD